MHVRRALAMLLLKLVVPCAGIGLLCACDGPTAPPPNVLFIVSDTLRADALDCDRGGKRTPALCSLAKRGVVFENTYAGGPWTLPSSVSMLTGSHPTTYATLSLEAARDAPDRNGFFRVPDDEILLADALTARGYDAIHFAEGGVAERTNVFQGMAGQKVDVAQAADDVAPFLPAIREDVIDPRYDRFVGALQFLAKSGEQPFFLLVWIHDPHAIYAPPIRFWKGIDPDPPYLPHPANFYARLGHKNRPDAHLRRLRDHEPFMAEEKALLIRLYHAEVESVDYRIGQILEILRQRNLMTNTVIAFTSDHGEGFGEHKEYLHGNSFYEELMKVPLILAGPGFPSGQRVTERVSHIDLMPTLCDVLDVDCLQDAQGASLRRFLKTPDRASNAHTLYAAAPLRNHLRDMLIEGDYKLIVSADETVQLYDLARDPRELRNLVRKQPAVVRRMRATLETVRADNEERRRVNLGRTDANTLQKTGDQTLEQLRALGYVE